MIDLKDEGHKWVEKVVSKMNNKYSKSVRRKRLYEKLEKTSPISHFSMARTREEAEYLINILRKLYKKIKQKYKKHRDY